MKTLVLGLGNPILSDEGIGHRIALGLHGRLPEVDVATVSQVDFDLLDALTGYERVFLVDVFRTEENRLGELRKSKDGAGALHLFSSHGLNFFELMRLWTDLGRRMPQVGWVYGIGIGREFIFGETLSPALLKKTEAITRSILADLKYSVGPGS